MQIKHRPKHNVSEEILTKKCGCKLADDQDEMKDSLSMGRC